MRGSTGQKAFESQKGVPLPWDYLVPEYNHILDYILIYKHLFERSEFLIATSKKIYIYVCACV